MLLLVTLLLELLFWKCLQNEVLSYVHTYIFVLVQGESEKMSLSSVSQGKKGREGTECHQVPDEHSARVSQGLVSYQGKMLIFFVMVLTLLPCSVSSFQKLSTYQNAPFIQFYNIFAQGKRLLTILYQDPEGVVLFQDGEVRFLWYLGIWSLSVVL